MKHIKCRECGELAELKYSDMTNQEMEFYQECFLCNFWNSKIRLAEKGDERIVRIDGIHYWLGDEDSNAPRNSRGSLGRKFTIEFLERGRGRIKTTNLYRNGEIPERFKDRLPDNAKFIKEKEDK